MAAVSLFWNTNMAAVTSCENTLYAAISNFLLPRDHLDQTARVKSTNDVFNRTLLSSYREEERWNPFWETTSLLERYTWRLRWNRLFIIIIHSKIFRRFWLAKIPRIIHHNQLLLTKFGRILRYLTDDVNRAGKLRDYWTTNRETRGRVKVVLVVSTKWWNILLVSRRTIV